MNDASSNRAQCHNINNIYFQAKLQPGLLIPVIKANGSSVLISASLEPTGRVWKLYLFFFGFFFFFLATSWEEGDRADPHTLPGSREQRGMSRATAGAAAFAQSRETKERSSSHKDKLLLQPITGIIRKTPAKRQNQAPFLEEPIAGSDSFQQPQPHSRGGFASRRFQATPERFLVPFASLWSILG